MDIESLHEPASSRTASDATSMSGSQSINTPSTTDLTKALGIPTKTRARRVWTPEEDETLRLLVSRYGDQCGKNSCWNKISANFDNRSSKDCRKRWFHSLDPKLKRGRWTDREDQILIEAYNRLGSAWHKISQLIPGRTDDQCSKRYNDVLDPNISERLRNWTPEEDEKLLSLVSRYGTQWRDIAKEMECRTGLTCRNRWRKLVSPVVRKSVPRRAKAMAQSQGQNQGQGQGHNHNHNQVASMGQKPSQLKDKDTNTSTFPLSGNQMEYTRTHMDTAVSVNQQPLNGSNGGSNGDSNGDSQSRPSVTATRSMYTIESNGTQRALTAADVEAILVQASIHEQKVVIMQHNYHYHYHYDEPKEEGQQQNQQQNQRQGPSQVESQFSSFAASAPTQGFDTPRLGNHLSMSPLYPAPMFQRMGISPGPSDSPQPDGLYNTESVPPTTPGFLELELMDMEEDVFGEERDEDASLDLDDFHIPFNPS